MHTNEILQPDCLVSGCLLTVFWVILTCGPCDASSSAPSSSPPAPAPPAASVAPSISGAVRVVVRSTLPPVHRVRPCYENKENISLNITKWSTKNSVKNSWLLSVQTSENNQFNLSNAEGTFIQSTRVQRCLKTIWNLSCWYSLDSASWVLSDKYSCQGFSHFSLLLHHSVVAKLATSIIRVERILTA